MTLRARVSVHQGVGFGARMRAFRGLMSFEAAQPVVQPAPALRVGGAAPAAPLAIELPGASELWTVPMELVADLHAPMLVPRSADALEVDVPTLDGELLVPDAVLIAESEGLVVAADVDADGHVVALGLPSAPELSGGVDACGIEHEEPRDPARLALARADRDRAGGRLAARDGWLRRRLGKRAA